MLRCTFTSAVCLLLLAACSQAQDLPEYTCQRPSFPLVIDGKGDDAAWQQAALMSLVDVRYLSGNRYHPWATEVRLLWDDANLYALFVAQDPEVWSNLAQRDDPLWDEEVVELFCDPDADGLNYVEIEVNSRNTVVDLLVSKALRLGGKGFFEWNPALRTAVYVAGTLNDPTDVDQYWSTEIALPWQSLRSDILDAPGSRSLPPAPGDRWRFNFYRYERVHQNGVETEIQYSAWSPVGRVDFHVPERFGVVTFAPAATAVAPESWGAVKEETSR